MTNAPRKTSSPTTPQFDAVLKRMLSSPPKQHKDERAKPNPAAEPAEKKRSPRFFSKARTARAFLIPRLQSQT